VFESLTQLVQRLHGYLLHEWLEVAVEVAVIWTVVYLIVRFLRGTRGARVIKGTALLLILAALLIQALGRENAFARLHVLYANFVAFVSLAMVIVFAPEIRRALSRLGEASLFRPSGARRARVIDEIINSVAYLSKNKIGGLIAIERQVGLQGVTEPGIPVDAIVTQELLNTIFWPGSALHDMGVIIRGNRLVAAGVQFPLAEGQNFSSELGSRHRAALGLSQETDALVLVVSEETGTISIAERGQMVRNLSVERLRKELQPIVEHTTVTHEAESHEEVSAREAV